MKVLLSSVPFAPSIGGIETVSASLAEGLTLLGCEVVVITRTATDDHKRRAYRVLRRPGILQLLKLVFWSDVVLHNSINLRSAWPLLVARRPWVVAHHMWLPRRGSNAPAAYVKRSALKLTARNIAVSSAMAADIDSRCTIIPNPYDSSRFRLLNGFKREREMIFVGRLVSDKGVNLLLDAVALLGQEGARPRLTIVGSGPEEAALRNQVAVLKLESQVSFAGSLVGDQLVRELNSHRLIIIPSLWREPFGIVALEGMACGCIPIAADGGGLPDAIGPCGLVFNRGDASDLANKIQRALTDDTIQTTFHREVGPHLQQYQKSVVAERYRQVLAEAVDAGPKRAVAGKGRARHRERRLPTDDCR